MSGFEYRLRWLDYLDHPYNETRTSERAVELPIALAFLRRRVSAGLEVGNVLSHYPGPRPPLTIVDLDERAPGVLNEDIRTWSPEQPFDWLVSISTIEHVGWPRPHPNPDEVDLGAAANMVDRLRSFVKPGAPMLVTAPLGFNPGLDVALLTDPPKGSSTMVTDDGHDWYELHGIWWRSYGVHTRAAAAVWVWETP